MINKYKTSKSFFLYIIICFISVSYSQDSTLTLENIFLKNTFKLKPIPKLDFNNQGNSFVQLSNDKIYIYSTKDQTLTDSIDPKIKHIDEIKFYNNYILIFTNTKAIYRYSTESIVYLYHISSSKSTILNNGILIRNVQMSPDNRYISYCYQNNLYVYSTVTNESVSVTNDGKENQIINGFGDWVYEEELNVLNATYWNAQSTSLAYLKFDESDVKVHTLQYFTESKDVRNFSFKYPKSGDDGSKVSLWNYDISSQKNTLIKQCDSVDFYIPRVFWTHDSKIGFVTLNRLQNNLNIYTAQNNKIEKIYTENNDTYIEIDNDCFLNSENLFFTSDKSGLKQIYQLDLKSNKHFQVTNDSFPINEIVGLNNEYLYFITHKFGAENKTLAALNLKTKKIKHINLIGQNNVYAISNEYLQVTNSTINSPTNSYIYSKNLKQIKTHVNNSEKNTIKSNAKFEFVEHNFAKNPTLFYESTKPNANKLMVYQYSGPGSQSATNSWKHKDVLWFKYLNSKGVHVLIVDPRGTGGQNAQYQKCTYANLGEIETKDIYETTKYYAKKYHIDSTQISIFGWSFGGYISLLSACNYPNFWKKCISVAPVTDWKLYDNIYTERYMQTPQKNPTGYKKSSVLENCKNINSEIFLIHGTADDNVHVNNSYLLYNKMLSMNKLIKFDTYPDKNHGIYGGNTRYLLYKKISEFILSE